MKKSGPDRQYTEEFRQSAVKQVIDGGRSIAQVARALEMSKGTLGNWVSRSRRGEVLRKQSVGRPVSELESEVSRLRAENSRLKLEKEILKNRPRGLPRPIWIETRSDLKCECAGQRPLAFWRHSSPSKNLAQGKLRTHLWWHLV